MSAAHLYIFGWSQIKFSEVETEELRFGEQCAKTLDAFERIFSDRSPSEFRYLQKFLLVDTSEDPDFQGDPLNNLTNTNREGGRGRGLGAWAGLMGRVQRVAGRLALCPRLTTIVLPFASDLVLAAVSECPNLSIFQNVYRLGVIQLGRVSLNSPDLCSKGGGLQLYRQACEFQFPPL